MNVKWEDVKEDFARKDAEIKALKAMNSKLLSDANCVRTIKENYEDLADILEPLTGMRDNHFDTIMNFIDEYKKLKSGAL